MHRDSPQHKITKHMTWSALDELRKLRGLLKHLASLSQSLREVNGFVTIDESVGKTRASGQYLPLKPTKWSVKVWITPRLHRAWGDVPT